MILTLLLLPFYVNKYIQKMYKNTFFEYIY